MRIRPRLALETGLRGVLALAGLVASATPAWPAPAPAATCQAAQLAAAGRFFRADLGCFADDRRDELADPEALAACREVAAADFAAAGASALAAAGPLVCSLDAEPSDVAADLVAETDALVAAISGGFDRSDAAERRLHGSLLDAAGSGLAAALNAESKAAKKPDEAKRLAARAKARDKLLATFAKALAKAPGVAYPGLSADATADEVDRITDELAAASAPLFFAVSGAIQAADGSAVDSDVNDVATAPLPNDTVFTPQTIAVPAALGGYVNLRGQGPEGNSRAAGDPSDFYRVSLAEGQRVNLRFADPFTADLDLCIYTTGGFLLACSEGISETEEIYVPVGGEYVIEVFAYELCRCGSSYVLTLGQGLASEAGGTGLGLDDEFVPGELVVTLAPEAQPLAAGPPAAAAAYAASLGLEARGGASDREMLFRLPAAEPERAATFRALGAEAARAAQHVRHGRGQRLAAERREKLDTIAALKALHHGRKDLASVEPNWIRRAQATPNDSFFGLQWHYPLINLPAAWDIETGSDTVQVAVIDTGALYGHPDLSGQLSTTLDFDFVSDPFLALDGNGIDPDASDPGDGAGIQPSSFHGTHVAGTIGARTNNESGVAGVAWDVTIVPLRALGLFGSGTSYDILQAVRYAAGLANDSGTQLAAPVDVINLSLGGSSFSGAEQSVYTLARNAGVIVVAAAGNNNSSQPFYPAAYDGVVSVSAVDLRRQKAPYSNFGSSVDIAAPGGDTGADRNGDGFVDGVLSTLRDEASGSFDFAFYQGTSMAAPHVAGVAALMRAVSPGLSPSAFDALLAGGSLTTDLGSAGRDDVFGHGLVDARKAVEAAGGTTPTTPILLVSPPSLNLGATLTQASFSVRNGGGGALDVTSVVDDQPWLSVSPSAVDGAGLGTYQASVDRSGLADGTYTATITVTTSAGTEPVSVVMAVATGAPSADAGFHYVLLIEPTSFAAVAQFDVAADGGVYDYAFASIPRGTYLLYAGSDTDNDFFICGTGEACGAYPTLGRPELIEVTGNQSALDFVSGFLQTLGAGTAGAGAPRPLPLRREPAARLR